MTPSLAAFAHRLLVNRGVEIRLGAGLKAVTANAVIVEDKQTRRTETIGTRTAVATVPAGPHPILTALPLAARQGAHRRRSDDGGPRLARRLGNWRLRGHQASGRKYFATHRPACPATGQDLRAEYRGILSRQPKKTHFAFTGLGKLGSLGRRSAVAEILGFRFKGLIAWLLWRGVYVTKFPGLDGQLRLIADWILDVFLPRDITQLRLFHDEAVHREHFEAGETVFANGDFGDKVYFIVKGEAAVERDGALLARLHPGDVFGEAALISNQPRNATIRATAPLDTVAVSREAFQELLMHLPGLNDTMQELMSGRLKRGEDLRQHDAQSRRPRPRRLISHKFESIKNWVQRY